MSKKNLSKETGGREGASEGDLLADHTPLLVRLGAMALGPSLDERLADGQEPDASPLLTARTLQLSAWSLRRAMADSWLDLLVQARERLTPFDPRVRPLRGRVVDAEGQIRALADALVAPLITAKGVAMASSLLSDGAGPLYNPASVVDLRSVLSDVLRELVPC